MATWTDPAYAAAFTAARDAGIPTWDLGGDTQAILDRIQAAQDAQDASSSPYVSPNQGTVPDKPQAPGVLSMDNQATLGQYEAAYQNAWNSGDVAAAHAAQDQINAIRSASGLLPFGGFGTDQQIIAHQNTEAGNMARQQLQGGTPYNVSGIDTQAIQNIINGQTQPQSQSQTTTPASTQSSGGATYYPGGRTSGGVTRTGGTPTGITGGLGGGVGSGVSSTGSSGQTYYPGGRTPGGSTATGSGIPTGITGGVNGGVGSGVYYPPTYGGSTGTGSTGSGYGVGGGASQGSTGTGGTGYPTGGGAGAGGTGSGGTGGTGAIQLGANPVYQLPGYNGGAGQYSTGGTSYGLPGFGQPWSAPGFNPNGAGFAGDNGQINPVYYGYQIGASGDPSLSYVPDLTSNDPNRIYRNAQNVSYNLGAGIDADLNQQYQNQQGLYAGFGNAANSAYTDLANTPGYTDQEMSNIIREPQYQAAMTTADQYASLAPTSAETAGMTGNTGSYMDFYNPQAFTDINNQNQTAQQGIVNQAGNAQNSAIGSLQSDYGSAINPNNLEISGDYARQAGMTDQEVEDTVNAAGRNVGLQAAAQKDAIARAAAAAGNTSPLALAAAQNRANMTGEVNAADAMTNARLAARQQQRDAATGVEQTRLGAEQALTGYNMGAATNLGQQRMNAAQYQGSLAQNAQNQINQAQLTSQQYLQNAGTGIRQAQDAANTSRAAGLYGIRQGNTQYQQQSQYQQGMGVNSALSNLYGNAAQQRIAGQGQYRNYLTGQQGQALGAAQTAQQQRTANYGTMTGALNANAGQWGNYAIGRSALPSGWQQVAGALAQSMPNLNP